MKKNKILLVEDHEILAKNITRILEARNYEIVKVLKRGDEVLKYLENNQPTVVLLDIFLEGKLDGIQTAALIEKKWNLPIIFLTSSSEKEVINRAKKTGAFSYVTKDEHLKEQLPVIIEFAIFKHTSELENQKAYQKLIESESKFKSIASSANDAIILIDNDGSIAFWNKSASRIFGYNSKEIKAIKFYDLITRDGVLDLINLEIITPKGLIKSGSFSFTTDMQAFRKDSEEFPIELSMSNVKLNGIDCACAIIRDSTLKLLHQDELKKLIEELQLSRSLTERNANELELLYEKMTEYEDEIRVIKTNYNKLIVTVAKEIKEPILRLLKNSEYFDENNKNIDSSNSKELDKSVDETARQILKSINKILISSKKEE